MKQFEKIHLFFILLLVPVVLFAANNFEPVNDGWYIRGIRVEFFVFALTLIGIAFFHSRTLTVALIGLVTLLLIRFLSSDFNIVNHIAEEWEILVNLLGLLLGFSILAKHFEESGLPDRIPGILPASWLGPMMLLVLVFVMSSFLDNIAAAMIGGSVALVIFRQNLHIGYVAAIVAASNAGGAGSVVGDTTTTMMWIDGVSPKNLIPAYIAAVPALIIFGSIASRQQFRLQPVVPLNKDLQRVINWKKILISFLILIGAISTNILLDFPAVGVWIAIIVGSMFSTTPWKEARNSIKGTMFLLAVVTCASLVPVEDLPSPSWQSAFILGAVSSLFDNIPLTKMALDQSNYDWALLAYAVGFGGSITWFGSSAGVAITNLFPIARNLKAWLKGSWYIALAYTVGFAILYLLIGWHPHNHLQ